MSDKCVWVFCGRECLSDHIYSTSCDVEHIFDEGGILDNKYKYCPYCGKEIKENTEVKEFE